MWSRHCLTVLLIAFVSNKPTLTKLQNSCSLISCLISAYTCCRTFHLFWAVSCLPYLIQASSLCPHSVKTVLEGQHHWRESERAIKKKLTFDTHPRPGRVDGLLLREWPQLGGWRHRLDFHPEIVWWWWRWWSWSRTRCPKPDGRPGPPLSPHLKEESTGPQIRI